MMLRNGVWEEGGPRVAALDGTPALLGHRTLDGLKPYATAIERWGWADGRRHRKVRQT